MDHLNFFNPYESKPGYHEDNLTRAYLVVLKYSSHAFFTFIEYCRSNDKTSSEEMPISMNDYLEQPWDIDTQRANPEINANYLVSVLITDSQIETTGTCIQPSERNAIYDGIITFGGDLTIVIENKPRSANVWFDQLNPSRQNLADYTVVYSAPIVLEWKMIINQLNHLLGLPTMSGPEKMIIEDFLSFVDENFAYLNPFDSFHQCKGNYELLNRRILNLLKSVVQDENNVGYHRNWGNFIQTPYRQIQQIGLILNKDEKDYCIELSLYFGDTQRQAIEFYSSNPSINHLKSNEWSHSPNFHVSYMSSGLVGFDSDDSEDYLRFWEKNVGQICQQKREDVPHYLARLESESVIQLTEETKEQLNNKFFNTERQTLNICPGFVIIHTINSTDAEELDKQGKLKHVLIEKIKEGLRVAGLDGSDLLRQLKK
ncbi:MAG: hypothetical protein DRR42_04200 [Gammaproteobacteria bacterium]|nr:MAG: hypothetical protein DRR42_04200 [Gammaproteobacteria bacterium]